MKHETPITDFADETHLLLDRFKEAARLEKEATWEAARNHCAAIDKAVQEVATAMRPVTGLPSIHALQHEDEVEAGVALNIIGRLGNLARGVVAPRQEAA